MYDVISRVQCTFNGLPDTGDGTVKSADRELRNLPIDITITIVGNSLLD